MSNAIKLIDAGGEVVGYVCGNCRSTIESNNEEGYEIVEIDIDESGDCFRCGQHIKAQAAAALGRKGGSVKSPAKSEAAKARNAKRKTEGKPEGGRPKKPAEK